MITNIGAILEALASTEPTTLGVHGDAWRGDRGALLRELARTLPA